MLTIKLYTLSWRWLMTVKEMRMALGDTQKMFAKRYGIPYRSIQNWEAGVRVPPSYFLPLLEEIVKRDLLNRRTFVLPKYDPKKKNLPDIRNFENYLGWLKSILELFGDDFVFALDTALICMEYFLGRKGEILIFGYGDDSLKKYNGVVILGNSIDSSDVEHKDGLSYTSFNRTLLDSIDNERILDPQGILVGLNHYYSTHGESYEGLAMAPVYFEKFYSLAKQAI